MMIYVELDYDLSNVLLPQRFIKYYSSLLRDKDGNHIKDHRLYTIWSGAREETT